MNQTFINLVADQFNYGGVKYAATTTKEATDILVDDFGWNWLIGTQAKYVKRYKNLKREKDLLKISCYLFINWLKLGYHLSCLGTAQTQYTTVEVKAKYFNDFIKKARAFPFPLKGNESTDLLLDSLYNALLLLRADDKSEAILLATFRMCEALWIMGGFDKIEVHDGDTWNEQKEGKKDVQA
jgi:hypothetical protein